MIRPALSTLVLLLLPAGAWGQTLDRAPSSLRQVAQEPVIPDELVVGLVAGADLAEVVGDTNTEAIASSLHDLHLLRPLEGVNPVAALLALQDHPLVRFVEHNVVASAPERACGPAQANGVHCTVAEVDGDPTMQEFLGQPAATTLNLDAAQTHSQGSPAVVAVLDTGIDPLHSVFQGRLFAPGYDFVAERVGGYEEANGTDSDGNGLVDEAHGHGTHVAGLIVLANPDASLLPLRVLDSDGHGTSYDVALGLREAVVSGAQVVHMSVSMTRPTRAVAEAVALADALGVVLVAPAGNTGLRTLRYPAAYPSVVSVAAVAPGDLVALFSSYGPRVDVSAPGTDLYSALPGEQFGRWSGTSGASALVSGSIALMLSIADPGEALDAAGLVVEESVSIDALNPGYEGWLGAGRADALLAALALILG